MANDVCEGPPGTWRYTGARMRRHGFFCPLAARMRTYWWPVLHTGKRGRWWLAEAPFHTVVGNTIEPELVALPVMYV